MDDFAYFRLRIPLDLKGKIEAESKNNNRSMNAEILKIIEDHLQQKENKKLDVISASESMPNAIKYLLENSRISSSKQNPKDSFSILVEKIDKIDDDLKHIKEKLDNK